MPETSFEPYRPGHADDVARWLASERWPFHGVESPTVHEVLGWVAEGGFDGEDTRTFWIVREDVRAGLLRVQDLTDPTPVFDLRIASAHRRNGIGRLALAWIAGYVFDELDKHRVEGHTRVDNVAMRGLFRACGWVKEAHHRQAWPDVSGRWHDAVTYALLRDDRRTGRTTPVDLDAP